MTLSTTALKEKFLNTRQRTVALCSKLGVEDYNLQGAEFTSPPK